MMKIALYVENGLEQIVLTPETDTEKSIVAKLHEEGRATSIKRGTFYACQGGWTRQGTSDDSTIIVMRRLSPGAIQ